jgi:hypothetical protein
MHQGHLHSGGCLLSGYFMLGHSILLPHHSEVCKELVISNVCVSRQVNYKTFCPF